jgi:hypothetical protein
MYSLFNCLTFHAVNFRLTGDVLRLMALFVVRRCPYVHDYLMYNGNSLALWRTGRLWQWGSGELEDKYPQLGVFFYISYSRTAWTCTECACIAWACTTWASAAWARTAWEGKCAGAYGVSAHGASVQGVGVHGVGVHGVGVHGVNVHGVDVHNVGLHSHVVQAHSVHLTSKRQRISLLHV